MPISYLLDENGGRILDQNGDPILTEDSSVLAPVDGTLFSAFIEYSVSDTGVPYSQTRTVPLVLDPVTGTYSAKLSKVNQEERLEGIEIARITQDDQSFLARSGWLQT